MRMDLQEDRKEFEQKADQNSAVSGYNESTDGFFGMAARVHYKGEIFKSDDANESNNLWMDEILGQFDWDDIDPDMTGGSKPEIKTNYKQPCLQPASKNLYTERKRRKKLNDTLYKLRAVVPKISKMDKQSIIGDATSYVLDLQKKIREIEGEIDGLCSSNKGQDHNQITPEQIKPLTKDSYALEKRSTESDDAKKAMDKFKDLLEKKFVEIRSTGENGIYLVRIECKKDAGVLIDLTRALECFALEIVYSSACCFDEAIHYTLHVRLLGNVGTAKLEDIIRQSTASDCSG